MIESNIAEAIQTQSRVSKKPETLVAKLKGATKKIAPVWPLENFVAVNPYLGLTNKSFEIAAKDLAAAGAVQMTLPLSFYLKKVKEGKLKVEHITTALKKRQKNTNASQFISNLENTSSDADSIETISTLVDVVSKVTGKDWKRFMVARVSNFAASYFDKGQASWKATNQEKGIFAAWKEEAMVDLTPDVSGLKGFRKNAEILPADPIEAAQFAIEKLRIPEAGMDIYLHRLLLTVGGWSAFAARLDWDSELYGGKDGKLIEFLTVLLCWEACLLESIAHVQLEPQWTEALNKLSILYTQDELNKQLNQKLILQDAFDLSVQESIIGKFQGHQTVSAKTKSQASAQAIFCIDVRSEVFRRNLENADNAIETLGFAGFFAFPIKYIPLGHEEGESQCPVLLKTGPTILEEIPNEKRNRQVLRSRLLNQQVHQIWKSFKTGAVTCFSFVSPIGLSYLPKLISDSFGLTRPVPHPDSAGLTAKYSKIKSVSLEINHYHQETVGIPLDQQIQMAKNALSAMSLTCNFAKLVLIVGHGSSMVNNPHATGYDCGACGGHTGEANAKVAAAILNSREVRAGLLKENIFIPIETIFLACLHNTTTDEVTIYNENDVPADRVQELNQLKHSLIRAGQTSRAERITRLNPKKVSNIDKAILQRSKDWSQTRPEWGLAACSAFVVAPRDFTRGIDFGGSSFLHSYDWQMDQNFSVLELIMTAPMIVTSWINLQYYASTVDNRVFGSGNKTLHNVTAGVGVLEGFSGDLRVGLPWQAIHDGENYQHEPVRLNVIINAPLYAMNAILEKHKSVRVLCDNNWIHLLAMDDHGNVSHRYNGNLDWEEIS
ncbi:DUF2309 domain-containing protein [Chryseotalea sanaruensis]|uniref:Probable inorganic carbon transporter subunit DabA n=1 Tax=Chryseotalea sanaruensis TaxID=2482724 RepID=A0A401UD11_9BACT|nr:DUF2309 domain-containing protein [Chryseotalea sanaruensis]GCC52750.1 DUF2309 domain-containing protein [Chryseotalea sanaruensis]